MDGSRSGAAEHKLEKLRSDSALATLVTKDVEESITEPGHDQDEDGDAMFRAEPRRGRQQRKTSIQVVVGQSERQGSFVLTAAELEIREIVRSTMERQAAADTAQPDGHKQRRRRRFSDMVFTRRFTRFDRHGLSQGHGETPLDSSSPFHGFFTLFWVCIAFLLLRVAAHNLRDHGSVLGRAEMLHIMTDRDLVVLGLTDGVMCLATAAGLLLQRLVLRGYLRWERSGWILQNVWQASYLGAIIWWTYYRDWPWTHTIFVVLHGLVFVMKQHSYAFYNGYLSQVHRRKQVVEDKLQQLGLRSPTDVTITSDLKACQPTSSSLCSSNASQNDVIAHSPSSVSYRRRTHSDATAASTDLKAEQSEIASVASAIESGMPLNARQAATFASVLETERSRLVDELKGKCTSTSNAYPSNLTVANWADWVCLPTLVYELEYPRQERISWPYVVEKTAACFGSIWVMIVVSQAYIYPLVLRSVEAEAAGVPLAKRILDYPAICMDIAFPMLLEQLLTWYVIWECVLNVLAELTRFADRGFYGDWWNSVSWDQYARDWNRPVHNFLLRHVYHSSISAFNLSRTSATLVTFLLSALVHELVMWCLFKKVRGYLFMMQIMQVPLASMSKTKLMRGRKMLGNIIFWIGLFLGPSVITSLYLIV